LRTPRIRSISIRGFRAFGAVEQTLKIPGDIAAVWGPNSKGKTSLAEAVEFLLTGQIVRRKLMASTQDEFADALRNAHLPCGEEVYVAARVVGANGENHDIRRVLTSDYAKRQNCQSKLEIDGVDAIEEDLVPLGFFLSQPPLEAPVLAQHTLSYIFSVGPQDRATYFKSLLELTDLEDFRREVAALSDESLTPDEPLLAKLMACMTIEEVKRALGEVVTAAPDAVALAARFSDAALSLIEGACEKAPVTLDEQILLIERILAQKRGATYPVGEFERQDLPAWTPPAEEIWIRLKNCLNERGKVDRETLRLGALFEEALKLPSIAGIEGPLDCPLCGEVESLTPERVQVIREYVEDTRDYKSIERVASAAMRQLLVSAEAIAAAAKSALPKFLRTTAAERREAGFTITRMRELLEDEPENLIEAWFQRLKILARAATKLRRAAEESGAEVLRQNADLGDNLDPRRLHDRFSGFGDLWDKVAGGAVLYEKAATDLVTALSRQIDAHSKTVGWPEFVEVGRQLPTLRAALIGRQSRARVEEDLSLALAEIDRAKEEVLNDKFADYSGRIEVWWERLRPGEPTFFSAVTPRKRAKRTIDFKAGLSVNPDRSAPKVRDVIAVFSQSQLHCLGFALFLARAEHEGAGFVVLDDPVLSSDEDYRVHFNSTVLTELLALPMQVIVITQDHDTWEELETRYRHLGISCAQLFIDSAAEGTKIENTSDALLAKINRADSLSRGGHPDLRKACGFHLRDAGERFCKEMLVMDHHGKGDSAASLTDYDGKMLEWLCPHVEPLLVLDPSHQGKLQVFKKTVNRACHDNSPPGTGEMKHACGEIRRFVKDYLSR
jgi:hypothetical protein